MKMKVIVPGSKLIRGISRERKILMGLTPRIAAISISGFALVKASLLYPETRGLYGSGDSLETEKILLKHIIVWNLSAAADQFAFSFMCMFGGTVRNQKSSLSPRERQVYMASFYWLSFYLFYTCSIFWLVKNKETKCVFRKLVVRFFFF